eukprot:3466763-Rhodomonas_salina.1
MECDGMEWNANAMQRNAAQHSTAQHSTAQEPTCFLVFNLAALSSDDEGVCVCVCVCSAALVREVWRPRAGMPSTALPLPLALPLSPHTLSLALSASIAAHRLSTLSQAVA